MWEVARIRGSRASESTSGVEREPGEVHASRRPQRASSSTKARRPRYVSVAGIVRSGARRPRPPPRLHADRRELGRRGPRAGGTLPRARSRPGRRAVGGASSTGSRRSSRADFTLCGYSMGGRLALALALRIPQPGRAARAGLGEPGAGRRRRARGAAGGRRGAAPTGSRRSGSRRSPATWAAQPLFAGQPTEVAAAAHADRLRRSAGELAAQLRGLGTGVMPSLWERLGELPMPVSAVVGERDPKFRAIAERMGFPVAVVPGAGHARAARGARRRGRAPRGALDPWRRAGSGATLARCSGRAAPTGAGCWR